MWQPIALILTSRCNSFATCLWRTLVFGGSFAIFSSHLVGGNVQAGHDMLGLRYLMSAADDRADSGRADSGRASTVRASTLPFLELGNDQAPHGQQAEQSSREIVARGPNAPNVAAPDPSAQRSRQQALGWVKHYANHQVLFADEALQQLADDLSNRPLPEVTDWLIRTQWVRQQLDSPAWQSTSRWLHDFFAGQAVYSAAELIEFRDWVAGRDPEGLSTVLSHLHRTRLAKQRIHADAARMRERFVADQAYRAAAIRYAQPGRIGGREPSVLSGPVEQVERRSIIVNRPSLSRRVATIYVNQAIFGNRWLFIP